MTDRIETYQFQESQSERLDKFLVQRLPEFSRARLQGLIAEGFVLVNGQAAKKSGQMIDPGTRIEVRVPPPVPSALIGEKIPLDIIFENDDLLIVNKPAGMVVHPAAGHETGTLVHAVLGYEPDLEGIGGEERPGVVHRLDKTTSGVMVFARNAESHRSLNIQLEKHEIEKIYHAIAIGNPSWDEKVTKFPLRVNVGHKHRTMVDDRNGVRAETRLKILKRGPSNVLIEAQPMTGRTHQIRVHLYALGFPLLGDTLYSAPETDLIARPALHAHTLTFTHPTSNERVTFTAPYPTDFESALNKI